MQGQYDSGDGTWGCRGPVWLASVLDTVLGSSRLWLSPPGPCIFLVHPVDSQGLSWDLPSMGALPGLLSVIELIEPTRVSPLSTCVPQSFLRVTTWTPQRHSTSSE